MLDQKGSSAGRAQFPSEVLEQLGTYGSNLPKAVSALGCFGEAAITELRKITSDKTATNPSKVAEAVMCLSQLQSDDKIFLEDVLPTMGRPVNCMEELQIESACIATLCDRGASIVPHLLYRFAQPETELPAKVLLERVATRVSADDRPVGAVVPIENDCIAK